jgi:outer membrane lipoprotein-sorting protein
MKERSTCLLFLGAFTAFLVGAASNGLPAEQDKAPAKDTRVAEKIFRQMEDALVKAKALDVSFDVTVEGPVKENPATKLKGILVLAANNKARLAIKGDMGRLPYTLVMESDGETLTTKSIGPSPTEFTQEAPKDLNASLLYAVARSGISFSVHFLSEPLKPGQEPGEFKPNEQLRVSEFRMGDDKKLGEREVRVVHYKLLGRVAKEPFAVSVWLDAKTGMPLRRVIRINPAMTLTETYSKLILDEHADKN